MSILLAAFGAMGEPALDAVSLTPWSDIAISGGTIFGTNEDRTLTWSVGGARNISFAYDGSGTFQYRINSGSWVSYSSAFSLSSGQTLGWRYARDPGGDSGTATVVDDARSFATINTFLASYTP